MRNMNILIFLDNDTFLRNQLDMFHYRYIMLYYYNTYHYQ